MPEQAIQQVIMKIEDANSFVLSANLTKSQVSELLTEIKKLEQSIINRIEFDYLIG